jgi:hypothetical protein
VPGGLIATAESATTINLSWSPSTDNVAVSGYKVFRDSSKIATTAASTYSDTGLLPGTTHTYRVSAFDASGNESAQSASASATTTGQGGNSVIALDSASRSTNGNDVNVISWSHTIGVNGSNSVLIVGAVSRDSTDADRPVLSVTFNGVSLTRVRQDDEPVNNVYSSLWYLLQPTAGTNTITVTYTAPVTEAFGMSVSFTGVDPAFPIDANVGFTQSGGSSAAVNILSSANNAWLVDVQYAGADRVTPASGQTVATNQSIAIGRSSDTAVMTVTGPVSPAGTSTVRYSYSESSQVALSIAALRPAP